MEGLGWAGRPGKGQHGCWVQAGTGDWTWEIQLVLHCPGPHTGYQLLQRGAWPSCPTFTLLHPQHPISSSCGVPWTDGGLKGVMSLPHSGLTVMTPTRVAGPPSVGHRKGSEGRG